jgi:3-hydroxyacyl-CoA dehydrogenase/enoyl-CoA hydratase/3-hydroxybutyryl-CoA epimerase
MTTLQYLPTAGIVHLVFDAPGNANVMNAAFQADFIAAAERLAGESDLKGVILRSARSMFFAGGDLDSLVQLQPADAQACFEAGEALKAAMRRIETLGKPVVACINGAALGGGWELCLMSHARIAVNDPKLQLGLPEVTLGLLPGAGGVTRMVRLLGLQAALPFLLEGRQFAPAEGHKLGLIDQLVDNADELVPAAEAWIAAHAHSQQPWDRGDWRLPGGAPSSPKLAPMLAIAPAMLTAKTRGCYPAPKAILACAVEGAQVGFEQASRIESRYFVELACGQVSKNMIGAFWHQHNAIKRGASRPQGYPRGKIERVGILGAGLMGAGIACACAVRGLQVVLKDVDAERAAQGKAYTARVLDKRVAQGRMSESERDAVLARILPTGSVSDLADCELVIEAVFEDQALKARVTAETEAQLSATALFASNTSTLPISGLARASSRPTQFIGLHFFSPADKMPLVEIICGEQTDPATLARAYDFVLQIGKTPIVVGDSRGFFTSRVFGAYNREGIGLVGEGAGAARIENLALQSGFPVGPLAVVDEVGLPLARRIREQTEAALRAAAQPVPEYLANQVVDDLLDAGRTGKAGRAGFYDYPPNAPKHLWPDLALRYPAPAEPIPDADVRDRMLYIQPIESVRCLDEGVLRTVRDGNIGSIFGIGFPGWTGGVLQFINHVGLNEFIERADELADHYGERFRVPESLREKARRGEQYADQG